MAVVDPSIPLSFQPTVAFDPGRQMDMANAMLVLQQNRQKLAAQNALRSVFADPANLDESGQLKPEAVSKVMAVDPMTGLAVQRQITQQKEAETQLAVSRTELFGKKIDLAHEKASAALVAYETARGNGVPEAQARVQAQEIYTQGLDDLKKSGLFSEKEIEGISPQFDPNRTRGFVQSYKEYTAQKEREQGQAETKRHDLAVEGIERKRAGQAGWQVLSDPTNTDDKGNPVQYRYNAGTGQSTTLDGKQPYAPGGAAKMGGAGQTNQVQFTDSDRKFWASVIKSGGSFPPGLARTAAGSKFVQEVMKEVAGSGSEPGQYIAGKAGVQADERSLSNMTKMADAATSFERTASENFDLALKLAPKGVPTNWGPFINRWVEKGMTMTGDKDVPPYVTALLTAANEYAKIMSGSTGAQGSTVDSRREAAEMFSPYLNQGQIDAVVKVAKTDMANRKGSLYGQIDDIKARLRAAGSTEPTETQGQGKKPGETTPAAAAPKTIKVSPADKNLPDGTIRYDSKGRAYQKHGDVFELM